jgi:hypothetical protein
LKFPDLQRGIFFMGQMWEKSIVLLGMVLIRDCLGFRGCLGLEFIFQILLLSLCFIFAVYSQVAFVCVNKVYM